MVLYRGPRLASPVKPTPSAIHLNHPPLFPFLSRKGEAKISGGHPQSPAKPRQIGVWTPRSDVTLTYSHRRSLRKTNMAAEAKLAPPMSTGKNQSSSSRGNGTFIP